MADRAVALSGKTGLFAAALVAGLILAALVAVFAAADVGAGLGPAERHVDRHHGALAEADQSELAVVEAEAVEHGIVQLGGARSGHIRGIGLDDVIACRRQGIRRRFDDVT